MIVTRFSPSPTGSLHIGGVRTALYAYALARKNNGKFILRIEDTDAKRTVEGSEQEITEMLTEYGLNWDERYKQSERLALYKEYAEKLIENDAAYYCFMTAQELEQDKALHQNNSQNYVFRSKYRDMPIEQAKEKIATGEKYVVRLKVPADEDIFFEDSLQGKMKFASKDVSDAVLLKSDGFPTYHLAVVVDDTLMNVSHVMRGVEWIPSIPKHVLIYRGLNLPMPSFAHLTAILNADGAGKLSKRKGTVSAKHFIEDGYLPEAMLNYLMLLGWSSPLPRVHGEPERELYTLQDFIELFDFKDLNRSNPRFNPDKLDWFNQQYIAASELDALENKFTHWLTKYGNKPELAKQIIEKGPDFLQKCIGLEQKRIKTFVDLADNLGIYFARESAPAASEIKQFRDLTESEIKIALGDLASKWQDLNLESIDEENFQSDVRSLAESLKMPAGALFMGVRLAVCRRVVSPMLVDFINVIGMQEAIARIREYAS